MARRKVAAKRQKKIKKRRFALLYDLFELPSDKKRKGRSYQWVTVSIMGERGSTKEVEQMLETGWNPVSRAQFPALRKFWDKKVGGIVYQGQLLMERAEKLTKKAQAEVEAIARARVASKSERGEFAPDAAAPSAPSIGDGDFRDLLNANRERFTELDRGVPVTIKLELSDREVEAAAICHLSLEEYAQRRIQMGLERGEPELTLIETRPGFFRFAKFNLTVTKDF